MSSPVPMVELPLAMQKGRIVMAAARFISSPSVMTQDSSAILHGADLRMVETVWCSGRGD